jgi:hypothetical protein
LLPPLDVGDPEAFMAATVTIFASYPLEVMQGALHPLKGIPGRSDRPTLRLIKMVCDEIYAPILREKEREEREHQRAKTARYILPRPKRTPEQQARIDALVAETMKIFPIKRRGSI